MKKVIPILLAFLITFSVSCNASKNTASESDLPTPPGIYLLSFSDYSDDQDLDWTAVNTFIDNGIVKGFPESKLMPEQPITREELASLIARSKYPAFDGKENMEFSDVKSSMWSYESIKKAGHLFTGILTNKKKFNPRKELTKEELFAVLLKAGGFDSQTVKLDKLNSKFTDASKISPDYNKLIAVALDKGLINSYESKTFNPKDMVKRSVAIGLIYRIFYANQIAFKVNDIPVTMGQYMFERVQRKYLTVQQHIKGGRDFKLTELITQAEDYAKDFISTRILTEQKARSMGITLTSSEQNEIDTFIPQQAKDYGEIEYEKHLDYNCYNREIVLTKINWDKYYDKVKESVTKDITPSEADVQKYYDDNKDIYHTKKLYVTREIKFKTVDSNNKELPKETTDAIQKKAQEAFSRIKNGEDIKKLVHEYSDDKIAVDNEGRHIFSTGDVEKELENVVVSLQPGQLSGDLVKTPTAYYIVKLEEITPEKTTTLEEVRNDIKTALTTKVKDSFFEDTLKKWKGEAKLESVGIKI